MTMPALTNVLATGNAVGGAASRPLASAASDVELLQRHVQRCVEQRGCWSGVRVAAAGVHGFFVPRFATTLTLLLGVIVTVSMVV